ncbi:MAG: glycosyltransferase family 4 protein [Lentimicrobiaceae bacterium]|nr:glycosyltransferase family 4 protein [Lentimicrobiaceae bacterium]
MRILLINHYAGSERLGMEYRPYYLAREWARMGHEVCIVAASYAHVRTGQPETTQAFHREKHEGISYIWLKTPAYHGNSLGRILNILVFLGRLFFYTRRLVKEVRPDLVIASSTYPFDVWFAARIARKAACRLVYEVHDLWPLSPMELGGYSRWHPFIMAAQRAEDDAYQRADYTVSLLPATLPHMQGRGLKPERWHHIPNGVNMEEWKDVTPLDPDLKAQLDAIRQQYAFIVGYAGAHGVANALESFILTASQTGMQQVAFVLAGKGPEKERLIRQAADKGLSQVFFLPPVPKKQVPALLSRMDALYIGLQDQPLFRFGVSPNKLFDYMMAEKPVIYAIRSGNDLVGEAGCGISIPPQDPLSIRDAISQIMNMTEAARLEMGRKGSAFVASQHDYRVLAAQFLRIVQTDHHP